jgi:hypothetical protein
MYGNSGTGAYHSQVIGCRVTSGGNANIAIDYQDNQNYDASVPSSIEIVK